MISYTLLIFAITKICLLLELALSKNSGITRHYKFDVCI